MRQLFPPGGPAGDVNPGQLAALYAYPAAGPPGGPAAGQGTTSRPCVRANMVASTDGAASVGGPLQPASLVHDGFDNRGH